MSTLVLAGCSSLQVTDAELEAASGQPIVRTADVFGQGLGGPVVAEDGATIRRTPNGISVTLSMPTSKPGKYTYPSAGEAFSGPGHPEAFTLWGFVFNNPEACHVPNQCGPGDVGDPKAQGGAFFVAGHLVGGPNLTLSGHISKNTEPFGGFALNNPAGAEVHLAVAPHGALDPELMPEQIQTPTGPGPDIWWLALFNASE